MTRDELFQPLLDTGYRTVENPDGSVFYAAPQGYGPGMWLMVTTRGEVFEDISGYASDFSCPVGKIGSDNEKIREAVGGRVETVRLYGNDSDFEGYMRSVTE